MTVLHLPSDTIGAQAARTTLAAVPAVHAQPRCGDDVHEASGDDGGGDDDGDDGDDGACDRAERHAFRARPEHA